MIGVTADESGLRRTRGAEVNLAFRTVGAGPAVLLLHGTSANHAVWEPIADALASRATVISIDQRGHGRSDKPEVGYDGASFAADVITVLDALGIQRAIVAGHSLGARNAWIAASRHPQRVSAVMAVDYTPYVESTVLDALDARVAGGDRRFTDIAAIEEYLHGRYPRMPPAAVSRRAKWGYRQMEDSNWVPLAPAFAMRQLVAGLRTPWDQEFRDVSVPMTCLRGVDSAIVSEAAWQTAQDARPQARWVVIDDADHYVPEEQPDAVTAELTRILDTTWPSR
ncbi:alpha/beta fold hydrolase [Rathayibacter soli]|uniref:alpha/beta fold hydrolase n=1 Tax=Rathayibacter soli TaxID=3144168 RepID=UPI0027E4A899|nr:alpha/beta hydrolase [Glaciibacter superstes]